MWYAIGQPNVGYGLPGFGILTGASPLPKFMGRQVAIIAGEHDSDGFPLGPASICLEGAPRRQCYTPPKAFGNDPTVEIVQLQKDEPALLFSAATYGVSGWSLHFALLAGTDMEDLFADEMTISNQSQHAFWHEPGISASAIFLTAEFVQGPARTKAITARIGSSSQLTFLSPMLTAISIICRTAT